LRASRCAARIGGPSGSIVLGSVFRMDEWMEENGVSAADDEFVGRIMREREEAAGAQRLTRAKLRSVRKALSEGRAKAPTGKG
jgi:hypothetical protein